MTSATLSRPVALAVAAFGLGVTAGMRTQMPLALISAKSNHAENARLLPTTLRLFSRRSVAIGLGLSAAGEVVVDKLPVAPSRLRWGPLVGRLGFGAAAGAVLARGSGSTAWLGGTVGATGALAGTLAGYTFRVQGHRVTHLPDPVLAALEDVVAVSIGLLSLSRWPLFEEKR